MQNKSDLRKEIKEKLKTYKTNLSSVDFFNIIDEYNKNKKINYIAIYSPLKHELKIDSKKLETYFNLCLPFSYKNGKMIFRKINNLVKDECNILSSDGCEVDISDIDVIVVPGLSYNYKGYRLGHGNGYYDRSLKDYNGLVIGTCIDDCINDISFEESFDLKVDYIVSEKRIIKIG